MGMKQHRNKLLSAIINVQLSYAEICLATLQNTNSLILVAEKICLKCQMY